MKLLQVEQRSPEWYLLRRTKIGASDCPVLLMDKPPFGRTPKKLFREKLFGEQEAQNFSMARGTAYEEDALSLYNLKGFQYRPAVVEHPDVPYMISSLDGINEKGSAILEIKVVGEKTWNAVDNGEIPEYIEWQIQHQLECVPSAEVAILWVCRVCGDELIGNEILIERDPEMAIQLFSKEKDFYFNHMLKFVEP